MKAKNIVSIILNLLLMGAATYGTIYSFLDTGMIPYVFVYYFTLLTNIVVALVALWGVVRSIISLAKNEDKPSRLYSFTKLGTTASLILILVVCVTLIREQAFGDKIYYWLLHVVTPALGLIIYIFIDSDHSSKFYATLSSLILMLVFGGYSIPLILNKVAVWQTAPYPFLDLTDKTALNTNILIIAITVVSTYLVGILLWLINLGMNKILYKKAEKTIEDIVEEIPEVIEPSEEVKIEDETPVVEEIKKEEKAPAKKKTTSKKSTKKASEPVVEEKVSEPKKVTKKKTSNKTLKEESKKESLPEEEKVTDIKPEYRIYHVSKRASDGQWQVKFAKGTKAIKLFRTQLEAIDYAKKLAESQNGSIRVHSVSGKIRKA